MIDFISQIQGELPKSEVTPGPDTLFELCDKHRITPAKELPPMRFLFTFNDTPCMPVCELVAGTGKAKSGKTLWMSLIMACALNGEQLALKRNSEEPLTVLWFDTEQSEQSTQDILVNRIMTLAGIQVSEVNGYVDADGHTFPFDDKFYALNVRGIGWEMRKELLQYAIQQYKPDLVILDGTKDLMVDINDATQATDTIESLMSCAQLNKCCIVNVLHQNKAESDRNMRGSIGTELTNKAFEAFECELVGGKDDDDEDQEETFVIKHAMSRKKRARRKLYYHLNDQNLPEVCGKPDIQPRNEKGQFMSKRAATKVHLAPAELTRLFTASFENHQQRPFSHLMAAVLRLGKLEGKEAYYDLYSEALQQGIIEAFKHPQTGKTWVELKTEALPF